MTNIYEQLGARPILNAHGNRTLLGGNTPNASVRELMDESEEFYVDMGELIEKVGEHISDMLGVEAALVTPGCAAALSFGAAACITGDDLEKIEQVPDVTGMRHEIIIQRQLRVAYDRTMTVAGGKLVEIGDEDGTSAEQLEEAIGPNTAAIHYLAPGDRNPGALPLEEVIRIGHAHGIPIIVDAAGQVYPTDLLSKYASMGADLVAYGAKYFGAVNSSGMLTGRKDLVEVARKHSSIGFESDGIRSIGRVMKIDRQEVIAVYAALREWLTMNHEDRFAVYEARITTLSGDLAGVGGIGMASFPADGPADGLRIAVDADAAGKSAADVVAELQAGNPSIWVRYNADDPDAFVVRMGTLKDGGEQTIAERLREIL